MWPDRWIIDLFKTEFPIVLAPMADNDAIRRSSGTGRGWLAAVRDDHGEKAREQVNIIRQRVWRRST